RLFSMIVYKNIFPKDFSMLQLESGYVHTLFANKNNFIQNEIDRLQDKIDDIEKLINRAENEHLKSINELQAIKIVANYHISGIELPTSKIKDRAELIQTIRDNPGNLQYNQLY